MNKLLANLYIIIMGILFGYIIHIINSYPILIIVLSTVIGIILGYPYNIILKKLGFNSKNKIYILLSIVILIVIIVITNNYFSYINTKEKYDFNKITFINSKIEKSKQDIDKLYNNLIIITNNSTKEYINKLNNSKEALYKLKYNKIKRENDEHGLINLYNSLIYEIGDEESRNKANILNKNLLKIGNSLNNKNYEDGVDNFINLYLELGENNQTVEIVNRLKQIKNEFDSINSYDKYLKMKYNITGNIGYFIDYISNGIKFNTYSGKIFKIGEKWTAIIFITNLILIFIGIYITLDIFKTHICEIHKLTYKNFGKKYIFFSNENNLDGLKLNTVIKKLNNDPIKEGLLSFLDIYYINLHFRKCDLCNLENKNTIIELVISHQSTGIGKIKYYSFFLNPTDYQRILEYIEKLQNNIKETLIN